MQITQQLSWPVINWPQSSTPASQYTVFALSATDPPTVVATTSTTSATIVYDEQVPQIFQVRPSSGSIYGPEVLAFVVGYLPCRAWLRQQVRQALADRADTTNSSLNWQDDELNGYINDALTELNVLFPLEEETTILLSPPTLQQVGAIQQLTGTRTYSLPADFYQMRSVEYVTSDGKLHLFLKEKPFRGGESTATSYLGYPKLGILLSPLAGRYYPGHYDIYEGKLHLDWDPAGDGDFLHLRYLARRPLPSTDADLLAVTLEEMTLLSLRTQMAAWLRVEGQDTRLSRWRTRDDGSKRDDMPTIRHSSVIKQLYNELVNDRREMRPRVLRLVRR